MCRRSWPRGSRLLSTGHGRKSDEDDALSVAVVAATSRTLRPVQADAASVELEILTEYRDDLVAPAPKP